MKNFVKTWVVSLMLWVSSLSSANNFENNQNNLKNQTNYQLSKTLDFQDDKEIVSSYVEPRIITNAILDYFDEEVKMYKLSWKAKEKVVSILNTYLNNHPVLVIWTQWRMNFVIDDKKEFCRVVKELVNVIVDDMPFLVRKVWVPLIFGWSDKLQEKLDDLENTIYNMKEKQYKDVIFDYIWWIVKRVAKSVNWKMTVNQFYGDVSRYFPNKNSANISQDLLRTWNWSIDIKYMKYPFKK